MEPTLLWTLAVILSLTGLVGMIFPMLPGAPLLLLGLICGAWAENFTHVGKWTIAALIALTLLTYVVDFLSGALGAKRMGASKLAMIGATVGALVCTLLMGPIGLIIGTFAGAVIGDLASKRTVTEASYAGVGATIGMVVGIALKVTIGVLMIVIFVLVRLMGT
ncbi:MAG: DUF456 domain-containing protein [Methylobacillus sp.]|jgi:uncharacterized protein YqgC (DUF456 family)|nr:DUF456 domain-containing protein [Methylobacillus sp.]